LVDPLNVDEIAQGMQKVIVDRTLRAGMIAKGIDRAKDFGWEKCSRELLALFDTLSH
jgi:glycosyltransferase involved in cell wall biosynthesis